MYTYTQYTYTSHSLCVWACMHNRNFFCQYDMYPRHLQNDSPSSCPPVSSFFLCMLNLVFLNYYLLILFVQELLFVG